MGELDLESMTPQRPVFLDLLAIRLPVVGVVSFLHRVSGVLLVLSLPLLVWSWGRLLSGEAGAAAGVRHFWSQGPGRALLILLGWALAHHFLAGLRHLLLDLDVWVERDAARRTAWTVVVLAPLAALGVWLWP